MEKKKAKVGGRGCQKLHLNGQTTNWRRERAGKKLC